jgi:serine/threonine protein phosphatase 1
MGRRRRAIERHFLRSAADVASAAMTQAGRAPQVAPGTRLYAIGDIHGRLDLLIRLHDMIAADAMRAAAARRVLVYVGDYVDRGPSSAEVLDLLLDRPLPGFEIVHLLGNHEDTLLRFPDDLSVGPSWLHYGGVETLLSYGIGIPANAWRDEHTMLRLQAEVRRRVPRRHVEFMRDMPLTHAEGDYLFVHAGIRPGIPIESQAPEDLLWIRGEFLRSPADHGKIIVHGHTITEMPDVQPNRIGIDTGAFYSNHLTCLVLDGADRWFLQT